MFGIMDRDVSAETLLGLPELYRDRARDRVHLVVILGSVMVFFLTILAYNAFCVTCNPPSNPYWILQNQMADPTFHLVCLLTTVAALLPRYTFHVLRNTIDPSPLVRAGSWSAWTLT
ncbi:putative phospholipid-transporting ATPase VD [Merluccius polli]|uniref:Phospholipid-transporting ATPase VD n=1 Tax=Merluccius polli TaxID=89951 RepID=A0AA47MFP0_MERPO|nr:putative phospholipid-transporting ATPase VD [Merluccius polli]